MNAGGETKMGTGTRLDSLTKALPSVPSPDDGARPTRVLYASRALREAITAADGAAGADAKTSSTCATRGVRKKESGEGGDRPLSGFPR